MLSVATLLAMPAFGKPLLLVSDEVPEISDPLEPINRVVFGFNREFRRFFAIPMIEWNRGVLPENIRDGLVGILENVDEPQTIIANLLQGELKQAGRITRRFLTNTFMGWGGAVDVAAEQGLERAHEDLRHVFCRYDMPEGPYVMLPLYGGATMRDQVGIVGSLYSLYFVLGELYIPYRVATGAGRLFDDETSVGYLRDGEGDVYARVRALEYARSRALC